MIRVLIIDDDPYIRDMVGEVLSMEGFEVLTCESGEEGIEQFRKEIFEVVITDMNLPGIDGIEVIKEIMGLIPQTLVIVITGNATIDTAIESLKQGAADYIRKPLNPTEIPVVIQKALKNRELEKQNKTLKEEFQRIYGFENIIGKSSAMKRIFEMISLVSQSDSTVLITGESGTGKELVAKAIHYQSDRKDGPLVSINSSAIPETLLEDELFGHEKGAYTGAHALKPGRFERAHKGTLFLDEIGVMGPPLQVKLLRVLQEKKFERVGGTHTISVNVRIIAATSENIEKAISENRFRQDLYYRLNVFPIEIPPLRERREDIPLLVNFFLKKLAEDRKLPLKQVSNEALRYLFHSDWPGNVRELENCIERAIVMSGQRNIIEANDLTGHSQSMGPSDIGGLLRNLPDETIQFNGVMEKVEAKLINHALQQTRGNKTKAAEFLNLKRTTLIEKIKKNSLIY